MKNWIIAAAIAIILVSLPADAWSQGRARRDPAIDVRRDGSIVIVIGGDDRRVRRAPAAWRARSRGPAFCRSGAGHPVHGRAWCRQKGFGLGADVPVRIAVPRVIIRTHRDMIDLHRND